MMFYKIGFAVFLLCICSVCGAQQNDWNLGFEAWSSTVQFNANNNDPSNAECYVNIADDLESVIHNGPIESNQIVDSWSATSFGLLRSTDAHTGHYAAVVCMWYNGGTGILSFGHNTDPTDCKVHFENKIYSISGYYKYIEDSLGPNDTYNKYVTAHVKTYRVMPTSGTLETLSHDSLIFTKSGIYQPFQLSVLYPEPDMVPDSVRIWFESNGYGAGTTTCGLSHFLYLDDLNFHFSTTSVETVDQLSGALYIYPNPAKSNIYLQYRHLHILSLQLSDLSGRIIQTFAAGSKTLDVSGLSAGIYFLTAKAREGKITKKVMVD